MGLLVTAADRPAQGQRTIVVRAFKGFGQFAGLKINEEDATRDNLESRLSEIFKNRAEKVMFLRADEELPFGDVAQVIDIGLSSGARVIVLTAKAGPSSDQGAGANVAGEPAGGVLGSVIGRPQIAVPKVAPPQRVRVSQGVMQALLQSRVEPDYPPLARQAHIQGTVVLRATIGKDGTVQNLLTVSGHPMLIPAAVRAVRQWRYKPYYLNGEPVKVETQIPVAF